MNNNSKSNTEKIKFICLPGGGTSSVVFYKWFGKLNEKYRPNFIDLPGRGLRKSEEPLTNIDDITNDLFNGLKKVVEDERNENYVLFAYCMGSIFLYELLKKIEKENFAYPIHIFLVAADVPYGEMYKTTFLDNPATKFQFYDLIRNCFPEHTFKDTATLKSSDKNTIDIISDDEDFCHYADMYKNQHKYFLKEYGAIQQLSPFKYIEWNEDEIIELISKELLWKRPQRSWPDKSANCSFNYVAQYLAEQQFGYAQHESELSVLIRNKELSRSRAIEIIETPIEDSDLTKALDKLGLTIDDIVRKD